MRNDIFDYSLIASDLNDHIVTECRLPDVAAFILPRYVSVSFFAIASPSVTHLTHLPECGGAPPCCVYFGPLITRRASPK
jgi:hypothetical protein